MNKNTVKQVGRLAGKIGWEGTKIIAMNGIVAVGLICILGGGFKSVKSMKLKDFVDLV